MSLASPVSHSQVGLDDLYYRQLRYRIRQARGKTGDGKQAKARYGRSSGLLRVLKALFPSSLDPLYLII